MVNHSHMPSSRASHLLLKDLLQQDCMCVSRPFEGKEAIKDSQRTHVSALPKKRGAHLDPVGDVFDLLCALWHLAQLEGGCQLLPIRTASPVCKQRLEEVARVASAVHCSACLWARIIRHHLQAVTNFEVDVKIGWPILRARSSAQAQEQQDANG